MIRVDHTVHLARRLFGALSRRPPTADDDGWAVDQLLPGEQAIWWRMDVADRRHAVGVARKVVRLVGEPDRAVVAAALLHDCGKVSSGLGTCSRVGATMWAGAVGRERAAAGAGRVARYLRHDELGAALLREAGSDPLTVAWAGEHHQPPECWTLERAVAEVLKAADDD